MTDTVHLGFEVGTGVPVSIPIEHVAVTGQTQASGKTTTLEALVSRAKSTALVFITKRGERSFATGRRVAPYFRDRADWQFVSSIIDATLQEKNKFLRPWIMKICRTTHTLNDVQVEVRKALVKAKGIHEGVYTQLDAYLDLIVPEISRASLARDLDLQPGLNVMDVSGYATPMQMLFVQSALDYVNAHCTNTIVVCPEAWEFVPEGRGSPVKASAIALVRKGAGIGNHIWVDSQDMAGVDKTILRGCTVWLIGVQREFNEIRRNLANIPASISRPSAGDVATLERGQFFACFGRTVKRVYVQPAWMDADSARDIALGRMAPVSRESSPAYRKIMEEAVDPKEAAALRAENAELMTRVHELEAALAELRGAKHPPAAAIQGGYQPAGGGKPPTPTTGSGEKATVNGVDLDQLYAAIKLKALNDPGDAKVLAILRRVPEIEITVQRVKVEIDPSTTRGRIAQLLAQGFYDEGATNHGTRGALKRTGPDVNNAHIAKVLAELQKDGFLILEGAGVYRAVPGMKVNIIEA